MEATVIDWDGRNLPRELRELPPGRYVVAPYDDLDLAEDEEAAIQEGLDDLEAGRVVPLAEVVEEIRARISTK